MSSSVSGASVSKSQRVGSIDSVRLRRATAATTAATTSFVRSNSIRPTCRLDFPIALLGRVSGLGNGLNHGARLLGRHDAPGTEQGTSVLCTDSGKKTEQLR